MHVDAYRLGGPAELDDLDLDTDLAEAVVAVEWGEGVAERLAERHVLVRLDRRPDDVRTAVVTARADGTRAGGRLVRLCSYSPWTPPRPPSPQASSS